MTGQHSQSTSKTWNVAQEGILAKIFLDPTPAELAGEVKNGCERLRVTKPLSLSCDAARGLLEERRVERRCEANRRWPDCAVVRKSVQPYAKETIGKMQGKDTENVRSYLQSGISPEYQGWYFP